MMNVVPGFAEIYFEVRGRVHYPKSRPMAEIREALEGIGRRRGVGVVVEILMEDEARAMSPEILAVIQRCAEDRGVPSAGRGHRVPGRPAGPRRYAAASPVRARSNRATL